MEFPPPIGFVLFCNSGDANIGDKQDYFQLENEIVEEQYHRS